MINNSHGKRMVREDLIKKLLNGDYSAKLKDITNIQSLNDEQINELKAGDVIVKKTGDQTHTYFVTYKEEGQGICLTYADATYIETVSYDYSGGHWVYNSKDVNHINLMEDIIDSDGNKRFIEGDITINTISGVTETYGKWSLSGTHLMIVIYLSLANGLSFDNFTNICNIDLPDYIVNKIVPLFSVVVDYKTFNAYAENWSKQSMDFSLINSAGTVYIRKEDSTTLTSDRNIRIQFDVLIDTK